jgi:hypothetical protein
LAKKGRGKEAHLAFMGHDVDVVSEMGFFGIDAKMTRGGIVINRAVTE